MLSVASLLNPIKSESRGTRLPSSPSLSRCTTASSYGSPQPSTQSSAKKQKMPKDAAVFTRGKIKGEVNYPPFETFDEETLRKINKFSVYPLGEIQEYSRHIPYNSEKKSFLEKTGRESFEVFQYVFKVPGDDKDYTVMWDYNIGLVRITPFFKCCNYSKTTPAKMLNLNPGLKEITHSITGGALVAQGYWMPYNCAFAVCTTFCSHIAPALIPIFGPDFPSQCVDPAAPEHGRMTIDPALVIEATQKAEDYRLQYSSITPKSTPRASYSPPQSSHHTLSSQPSTSSTVPLNLSRSLWFKRAVDGSSSLGTPTDTEYENGSETSSGDGYFCSPGTPSTMSSQQWGPPLPSCNVQTNRVAHSANSSVNIAGPKLLPGPNPWLSAIPRSADLPVLDIKMGGTGTWRNKRRVQDVEDEDIDQEYDGEESASGSVADEKSSEKSDGTNASAMELDEAAGGAEKKAAWLLMKLSVKDGESGADSKLEKERGPRVKRRRATSY